MIDSNELLRRAILKVLFNSKLKIFGCLIYKFDVKITNDKSITTACCTIDKINKKPVILFNDQYIQDHLPNETLVTFVLVHEMMHFIDGHLSKIRTHDKHYRLFNMAADHIINTLLIKEANSNSSLTIPESLFLVKEFEDKTPTLNEVYLWLKENKQFYDLEYNQETGMIDVYKNGEYIGSFNEDLTEDEFDKEIAEEISEELRSELRSSLSRLKRKGNNSSDLFKYFEELVELKLPWNVILENEIQKTRVKSNNNKTWKSLRKKMLHLNVTLPSTSTEEITDNLYVVQDTSGSLWNNEEEQNKFLNLILQSVTYFNSVKIIQHDIEIKNVVDLDRSTFELEKHKVFELRGGGGTSHKDVFEYIEEKYFVEREEIGMVILATDYESDVEEIWNNYEFHNFVPVKVLCTTDANISSSVDQNPVYV